MTSKTDKIVQTSALIAALIGLAVLGYHVGATQGRPAAGFDRHGKITDRLPADSDSPRLLGE